MINVTVRSSARLTGQIVGRAEPVRGLIIEAWNWVCVAKSVVLGLIILHAFIVADR